MSAMERLSAGEGDILELEWADGNDAEQMRGGCHYDYTAQVWRDGHDHAHYLEDDGQLYFCGADLETCASGHKGAPWERALRSCQAMTA